MQDDFDHDELLGVILYDPETGLFTWIKARRHRVGKRAGSRNHDGYRRIHVGGCQRAEHRLAWLYMTGEWPAEDIDHKNRIKDDNRWCNLRLATVTQNQGNSRPRAGLKGTTRVRTGKWTAQIQKHGIKLHLGTFNTQEEAHKAYVRRAKKLYKEFARASA